MHTKLPMTLEKINVFHLMLSLYMFDETTDKLLHDASYDLSDFNSNRLDNVAGNIAPKAVDELNYCCVNKLKTENVASASECKLKLSLIIYYL